MNRVRGAIYLAATIALIACGEKTSPPAPAATGSVAAAPADAKLAKLYDQTCKSCHSSPGNGVPQTGDVKAWQPLLAQGMPALLDHTINGYKGMPPLGACMDCTEADFEALIRFMAGV